MLRYTFMSMFVHFLDLEMIRNIQKQVALCHVLSHLQVPKTTYIVLHVGQVSECGRTPTTHGQNTVDGLPPARIPDKKWGLTLQLVFKLPVDMATMYETISNLNFKRLSSVSFIIYVVCSLCSSFGEHMDWLVSRQYKVGVAFNTLLYISARAITHSMNTCRHVNLRTQAYLTCIY